MIVEGRYTLDSNILVYAVDLDAPGKRDRAQDILITATKEDAWLTLQALSEFFHAVTRKDKATIEKR